MAVLRDAAREATDTRSRRPRDRECQEACAKHERNDPGDYPVTSHRALAAGSRISVSISQLCANSPMSTRR